MTIREVVVVVPANNEEALVADALHALLVARERSPVPTRIVVVDDASTDATATRARGVLPDGHPVVEGPGTTVGSARAAGVAAGCRGVSDPGRVWVASTDADSRVPADWLRRQVRLADDGVDAIAGEVALDEAADTRLVQAFRRHYARRADHRGPHLHAANLGLRLTALEEAGGWADRAHAEEHDLWARLPAWCRTVRDPGLVVVTSSRLQGRTPIGFADDLRRLHHDLGAAARASAGPSSPVATSVARPPMTAGPRRPIGAQRW